MQSDPVSNSAPLTPSSKRRQLPAALRPLGRLNWPTYVRRLGVVTAVVLFLVHVMGATVTDTGSQAGCGNSWPLCRGQFIPAEFARSTAIEFSHRLGVPLVTILLLALIVGTLALWRSRLEIRILAPLMFIFLFMQAILGGLAVMFPTSAVVLAFHFGVSSISVASVIVTTLFIYQIGRWDRLRDRRIPTGFRWLTFIVTAYTYIVIYLGAYVMHTNSQLACTSWPLCDAGRLLPPNVTPVVTNVTHRVAAFILVVLMVCLFVWARRVRRARPDLYAASVVALALVLAQALEGAVLVLSRASIWTEVMHSAFVALFFSVMAYMCLQVLPRTARTRAAEALRTPMRGKKSASASHRPAPALGH